MAMDRILLVRFCYKIFYIQASITSSAFIAIVSAQKHWEVFLSIMAQYFESTVNLYRHNAIEEEIQKFSWNVFSELNARKSAFTLTLLELTVISLDLCFRRAFIGEETSLNSIFMRCSYKSFGVLKKTRFLLQRKIWCLSK